MKLIPKVGKDVFFISINNSYLTVLAFWSLFYNIILLKVLCYYIFFINLLLAICLYKKDWYLYGKTKTLNQLHNNFLFIYIINQNRLYILQTLYTIIFVAIIAKSSIFITLKK